MTKKAALRAVLVAVAALSVSGARASEVDLASPLLGIDGQVQRDCDHVDEEGRRCDRYVDMTLGRLSAAAVDRTETGLKPSEIQERGDLARKIRRALAAGTGAKRVDLTGRELDLIREGIPKLSVPPSIGAQAFDLLNGRTGQ